MVVRRSSEQSRATSYLPRQYDQLLDTVLKACKLHYGRRLAALAVYGSVGRATPRADSDIDLLLVADDLPDGRIARVEEFRAMADRLRPLFDLAADLGIHTRLAPIFKTPRELRLGTPLLLDMTEDARILHDPDRCLADTLDRLRDRLRELGSKRIWKGDEWYWDLKPDYKPGDVFDLFPQ
ncbi:MAG: nucleotidyltransferase domain-containing protein [Acidobacteriota bacterium]|nr:nucleotidyltransferase domain-containing protein [Acidobacteriota bacterium]